MRFGPLSPRDDTNRFKLLGGAGGILLYTRYNTTLHVTNDDAKLNRI